MEVVGLNADEFLIAREQRVSNRINDGGFSTVIPTDQRRDAPLEGNLQRSVTIAERAKVSN